MSEPTDPRNELPAPLARGLRNAALLVAAGLVAELLTLGWSHPLTFFAWAGAAALLVGSGVILYLLTILKYR